MRGVRGILIGVLIGCLIGGLVAWGVSISIEKWLSEASVVQKLIEAKEVMTVWDLLALPVLILIVLCTHEIGHLLGGKSQGMRFLLLIVGPFGWHASVSGIKFEWNTNIALMGGLAASVPTKFGASLRRQLLANIIGGPLASLLLMLLAISLTSFSDPRFTVYCIFVAATSFGIFLVTLIPIYSGGFMSDGLQIIDVYRGGSAVLERGALLQILAQSLQGVRPREWDQTTVKMLSQMDTEDQLRKTACMLYLLAHAMDSRCDFDISRYRKLLEYSVNGYPSGFTQMVHVELAICSWLDGDTDALRKHIKASQGGVVEKSRRLLAHAALAKLEGAKDEYERYRLLVIKELAKASDIGQKKLTEDQLKMLHDS